MVFTGAGNGQSLHMRLRTTERQIMTKEGFTEFIDWAEEQTTGHINKAEAYRIVFNDLSEIGLFVGKYDAKNGKKDFMFGISTVMESIAARVSDECLDDFEHLFYVNMTESEEKVDENLQLVAWKKTQSSQKIQITSWYVLFAKRTA